jgi:hypothetical protein
LKTLRVFDIPRVNSAIPDSRRYLMDQEDGIPQRVGEEYGGLIEEYLQQIVENRREQHYLLDQVPPSPLSPLSVPRSLSTALSGGLEGVRHDEENHPTLPGHLHGAGPHLQGHA